MTSFTLLSRVRRPDDGPLPARFLPAPSLVTRPPAPSRAARRGLATGRTISDTLGIGLFLCVCASINSFWRGGGGSPSTVFGLFLPEMTFEISGTNDYNKFFPNFLATSITYCFTWGMAKRPIRMANAPNPPDPYWRTGPRKAIALGVRIVLCPIWLAKWASINLARFFNLRVCFSNDHSKGDALLWLTNVTDGGRTNTVAAS